MSVNKRCPLSLSLYLIPGIPCLPPQNIEADSPSRSKKMITEVLGNRAASVLCTEENLSFRLVADRYCQVRNRFLPSSDTLKLWTCFWFLYTFSTPVSLLPFLSFFALHLTLTFSLFPLSLSLFNSLHLSLQPLHVSQVEAGTIICMVFQIWSYQRDTRGSYLSDAIFVTKTTHSSTCWIRICYQLFIFRVIFYLQIFSIVKVPFW